jgi:ATP-dependent Clp protease protease subunit
MEKGKHKEISKEERAKFAAEAETFLAEAEKLRYEALTAKYDSEVARMDLESKMRTEAEWLAMNRYHHVYDFTDIVTECYVDKCIYQLRIWERNDPKCDVEILFRSPGGDVIAGMHLFDYIQVLRRKGHKVTIGALGMAASMAGILLQAGDIRWMGAEAYVLVHQISTAIRGKMGEIDDEVKFLKKMSNRVLDIFERRCQQAGKNGTASHPLNRGQLERGWERKDWWLSSDECLKYGLVDEVR